MTPTHRAVVQLLRGVRALLATVALVLALAISPAAAQDYPDGGDDQPTEVQGEQFFPAPAAAPAETGSGELPLTGLEIGALVAAGAVLITTGALLRRRSAERTGR